MSEKLSISQWAEEDKPREKLERLGASALSNAELLAILIGSGSQDESAVDLMKHIMKDCDNNLNTLGKMTIKELTRYKGMGPAKAITVLAACELGKRRALDKIGYRPDLGSSLAIYNYMLPKMQDLNTEEAWVLMMNQNFKLIKAFLYLARRHYGNSRGYPTAHQGSRTQQRHHHCLLSQSPEQQSAPQQGRRPAYPSDSESLRNHAHLLHGPCHHHRWSLLFLSR